MNVPAVRVGVAARPASRARDLLALTKPRITAMVTATGVMGALASGGPLERTRALAALAGTLLVVAGANTLNMWLEREWDAQMERTRSRPLASGRVAPGVGLALGAGLSAASLPVLAIAGLDVAALGALALLAYVAVYTPAKRRTRWSLVAGAVAGAAPPAMGWLTTSSSGLGAAYLFALLFCWQLPHFVAIAIFRGEQYASAGFVVGAATERALARAKRELVVSSVAFVLLSLAAPLVGLGGARAVFACAVSGAGLVALALRAGRRGATPVCSRDVFAWTMGHLAIVLAAIAFDR